MLNRWSVVVVAVAVVALLAGGAALVAGRRHHRARAGGRAGAVGRGAAVVDRLASGPLRAGRRPVGLVVQRPAGRVPRRGLRRRPDLDLGAAGVGRRSSTSASASPPPSVEWELFSQSAEGAVVTLRLPESTDFDELADGLEELGYTRPDDEDGVWRGGSDLLPGIGPDLTPELQYVALDADERLVRTSDTADYLEHRARGRRRAGRGRRRGGRGVGRAAVGRGLHRRRRPAGRWRCRRPTPADQDQADELVEEAGEVNPLTGVRDVRPAGRRRTRGAVVRERRPGPDERRLPRRAGARPGTRAGR